MLSIRYLRLESAATASETTLRAGSPPARSRGGQERDQSPLIGALGSTPSPPNPAPPFAIQQPGLQAFDPWGMLNLVDPPGGSDEVRPRFNRKRAKALCWAFLPRTLGMSQVPANQTFRGSVGSGWCLPLHPDPDRRALVDHWLEGRLAETR